MASPLQQVVQQQTPPPTIDPKAQQEGIVANMITEAPQKSTDDDYLQSVLVKSNLASKQLSDQMALMRSNLERRTNIPFDPTLMQAAAGFLAPTKTGSFGESLGAAAGNAATQAEKDWLRNQETEKMKMELAQKQALLQQQVAGREFLTRFGEPRGTAQPSSGATGATGSTSATGVGSGADSSTGAKSGYNLIRERDLDILNVIGDAASLKYGEEKYKRQQEQEKQETEKKKVEQGEYGQKFTPYLLNDPIEGISVKQRGLYESALERFNKTHDEQELLQFYDRLGWLPPESRTATGFTRPLSKYERETTQFGNKAFAEQQGKDDVAEQTTLLDNYKTAPQQIALAREAKSLAISAPNAFKLLNNKDYRTWWDGLSAAAKAGITTPGGTISIPTDILEQSGLTNTEIQALQNFATIEARFSLTNARTYLKGQGSVSNMERDLVAQLGTRSSDRPEVIQMKADAIELRADFDKKLYMAYDSWRDKNEHAPMRKFITSADYDKVVDKYASDGQKLIKANAEYIKQGASTTAKPTTTAKPATNTAKPIDTTPDTTKPVKTPETFMQRLNRLREEDKKGKP